MEREYTRATKALVLAMLASTVIVLGGAYGSFQIGKRANESGHRLFHAEEGLQALRDRIKLQKGKEN